MTTSEHPGHLIDLDDSLCCQIELLMDGNVVHHYAALAGAYRSAVADYRRTGDRGMAEIAMESERELRRLLATLREKNLWAGDGLAAPNFETSTLS